MVGMYLTQPTHLNLNNWSACGLKGLSHRALRSTKDPSKVSCRTCRRWIAKNPDAPAVKESKNG